MGKIITVYPTMQGNGGKFTATQLAHALKSEKKGKVALVDFDLKRPFLAHALSDFDDVHGIDNITGKIDSGVLSFELFKENMIELKNGVDLLKGTKLIGKYNTFDDKYFEAIVSILRDNYDYVIIAVAPEADNAGTVQGLISADEVLMVVRNNIANLMMLTQSLRCVHQYKQEGAIVKGLYNMVAQSSKVDISRELSSSDIQVVGMVEYEEGAIDNQNINQSNARFGFKSKSKTVESFAEIAKQF